MTVKHRLFVIISFLALFGQALSAQDGISDTENMYKCASVAIKFYDKTMYYPGEPDSNPVFVHITIKNTGSETLRFKLADYSVFSVDFSAFMIRNTQLP